MSDPVRLKEGQSAEPSKCGSCKLFNRQSDQLGRGWCSLKFPPWVKISHAHAQVEKDGTEIVENSSDWTLVYDHEDCSFWRPSGLTYIKEQVWTIKV